MEGIWIMPRLCKEKLFPLLFALLLCSSVPCFAVEGMEFVDAEDKTGYYVDLGSVTWEDEHLLNAKIAVVKAATNRLYLYTMHFDTQQNTYRILQSEVYAYDTKELLESNGPALSDRFYGPASMMQEIIEYILYPESR